MNPYQPPTWVDLALEAEFPDLEKKMSEANGRLLLEMGPKDGTYIKVFMSTAPFSVIRNVYWCDQDEGWAEGGRIFIPELPISATWELMDEPINLKEHPTNV